MNKGEPTTRERADAPDGTVSRKRFDRLRDWAERARLVIYDYRRSCGMDHRNQELAESLDSGALQVMLDWQEW
jgi:hypothetical protein